MKRATVGVLMAVLVLGIGLAVMKADSCYAQRWRVRSRSRRFRVEVRVIRPEYGHYYPRVSPYRHRWYYRHHSDLGEIIGGLISIFRDRGECYHRHRYYSPRYHRYRHYPRRYRCYDDDYREEMEERREEWEEQQEERRERHRERLREKLKDFFND